MFQNFTSSLSSFSVFFLRSFSFSLPLSFFSLEREDLCDQSHG